MALSSTSLWHQIQITHLVSTPIALSTNAPAPGASDSTEPSASDSAPVDQVVLSTTGLRRLTAPPPGTPTPPPAPATPPDVWTSDDVQAALAALNDTTGKTSVAEQLSAYKLVSGLLSNPYNVIGADAQKDGAAATKAFVTSAYSQHVNSLLASIAPIAQQTTDGLWEPDSIQKTIDAFNALSADDQQTYVGGLNAKKGYQAFASAQSYIDNQVALLGVTRAARNAFANPAYKAPPQPEVGPQEDTFHWQIDQISQQAVASGDDATADLLFLLPTDTANDSWTVLAQKYFSAYGPPPTT